MRKTVEASLKKKRLRLLLSNLEKLRAEVSITEARYNILKDDYTKICDEAILKALAIETDMEESFKNEIGEREDFKPEKSNLEARFKLGLVPVEVYLKQKEVLSKDDTPVSGPVQAIIDKVADCIGAGFDKMADGIVLLVGRIVAVCTVPFKFASRETKK